MSKSVRSYANLTVPVNSNKGSVRQNSRLRCGGILRLLLVCTLFFTLSAAAQAQPGTQWNQQPNGTARPGGEGNGPHSFWMSNVDNAMGGGVRWSNNMSLTDAGGVTGESVTNADPHYQSGQLYVRNGLFNNGTSGVRHLFQLTVDGDLRNSNADNGRSRTIFDISTVSVLGSGANYGRIYDIGTLFFAGDLYNYAGAIIGGAGDGEEINTLDVSGYLFNQGPSVSPDRTRAEITNVRNIHAGILENWGSIRNEWPYYQPSITVDQTLFNGSNQLTNPGNIYRRRREAEIFSQSYLYITAGNLTQWFDGSIRAIGGDINVFGELYNAGEIRIITSGEARGGFDIVYDGHWRIDAGSIFNDGRSMAQWIQTGGRETGNKYEETGGGAWGIIYDAQINTGGNLTNIGVNAQINGMVHHNMNTIWIGDKTFIESLSEGNYSYGSYGYGYTLPPISVADNRWYSMHVEGDLNNLDRASIFNYKEIIVHGDLNNRGATLVGGHWFEHSNLTDKYEQFQVLSPSLLMVQVHQTGLIHIGGSVYNTSERNTAEGTYGGLIAGFDTLNIQGSLHNDANSMITGSYTHNANGTGPYGRPRVFETDIIWQDGGPDTKTAYTIYGRRANILGGVMFNGGVEYLNYALYSGTPSIYGALYGDTPSTLNVMGLSDDKMLMLGTPLFGLYNEGLIREIDIVSVGSHEGAILWNAAALQTTGARLPTSSAPDPSGGASSANKKNEGTVTANGKVAGFGTITDIGVLNVTNLYNEGTISDIDTAINVSYALFNTESGVLDGYSPSHVEWDYLTGQRRVVGVMADDPNVTMPGSPTRAHLRVGESAVRTEIDPVTGQRKKVYNPLVTIPWLYSQLQAINLDLKNRELISRDITPVGIGIINVGTITNFEQITSLGDLYNLGTIGGVPATTTPIVGGGSVATTTWEGGVTSLTVGSNMPDTVIPDPDTVSGSITVTYVADMYNAGTLSNIVSVNVTRDLFLIAADPRTSTGIGAGLGTGTGSGTGTGMGTGTGTPFPSTSTQKMFDNVGTITVSQRIVVDTVVDGGYSFLAAGGSKTGELIITESGELTIEPGSIASGWGVENKGIIWNGKPAAPVMPGFPSIPGSTPGSIPGVPGMPSAPVTPAVPGGTLISASGITNELGAYIYNSGTISAGADFNNSGTIEGKGIISLIGFDNQTGLPLQFRNLTGGTVNGGLLVNGSYTNDTGGTIKLKTDEILRITNGTASINGGTIDASAYRGIVGRQYVFLATDKPGDLVIFKNMKGVGSGTTGSVLDFTPVYGSYDSTNNRYIPGEIWSPNNQYYWLEVRRSYEYGRHAVTPNQIAVGEYIDTVGATPKPNSPFWNLLVQLDAISDNPTNPAYHPNYRDHQGKINPEAIKALDQLSGVTYANIGPASVHNVGVVNRSLADVLRSDVFKFSQIGNPNNAIRGQAIAPLRYSRWATLFGIGGTTTSDGNANGYRQSFGGVLAGIDRAVWTGTRIGGWLSLATGDVSTKGGHVYENTDVTDVLVGMYLRQEMYYGYGLLAAGFGVDDYKTQRNLTLIGHRAESKFHGTIGTAYLERGIDIPVYYATIQPYTSFQVAGVSQEAFKETMWNQLGQYSDVGLEGLKGSTDSYKLALGTRASSMPVPFRWGQVALTGNMAWFHEFHKDNRNFTARFVNPSSGNFAVQGTTFTIEGANPKQDWFNFGFGLNMDRNSTRLFVNADLFANSNQTLFSGGGGFITSW